MSGGGEEFVQIDIVCYFKLVIGRHQCATLPALPHQVGLILKQCIPTDV